MSKEVSAGGRFDIFLDSVPYYANSRYVSKNFKLAQRSQIVDQKKEKLFCFKMSLILLQCDLYIKSYDKF